TEGHWLPLLAEPAPGGTGLGQTARFLRFGRRGRACSALQRSRYGSYSKRMALRQRPRPGKLGPYARMRRDFFEGLAGLNQRIRSSCRTTEPDTTIPSAIRSARLRASLPPYPPRRPPAAITR